MRVAWDLQALTGPGRTGLGISVQFMLDALSEHAPEVEVIGLRPNQHDQPLRTVPDRLAWEWWRYPRALRKAHSSQALDLAYSPALGAPRNSPVPVLAHVHDLIPLLYPAQFRGVAGWYWRKMLPASWKRCAVLTVSNDTVADDLVEHLGYPRERIHVVPYYPDPDVRATAELLRPGVAAVDYWQPPEEPAFLTLASHEPRKNIELAIHALGKLKLWGITPRLVCIGGLTPHTKLLSELAEEAGVASQVEFPGYMQRTDVVKQLLNSTALLFVSRYEGYGMPPLEAMSIGVPVVLSDIACHRRIYNDANRLDDRRCDDYAAPPFVSVDDPDRLAMVMRRMLDEPGWLAQLHHRGLGYNTTFTAADTAAGLVSAFHAALNRN